MHPIYPVIVEALGVHFSTFKDLGDYYTVLILLKHLPENNIHATERSSGKLTKGLRRTLNIYNNRTRSKTRANLKVTKQSIQNLPKNVYIFQEKKNLYKYF